MGGAVVYDGDLFLYSHHATDPCSGQLVNAFDLVRLHMYGDRDSEAKEGTPASKMPSFMAMSRLALEDKQVSDLISVERLEKAKQTFQAPENPQADSGPDYDLSWLPKLTKDSQGRYEKTINNAVSRGIREKKNGAGRMWMTPGSTAMWKYSMALRAVRNWTMR